MSITTKLIAKLINALGWYGVAAIILAYILISFEMITVSTWEYQVLNLTGAIGIIIEATVKKDKQPAVLNIFWAMIAIVALIRLAIT